MEARLGIAIMIAGYWIEKRTNTTLFIAINNIRAGKDIDLEFYGYEELYLKRLSERITDTDSIKFIRIYSYNGAEQPQIERNLREGGFRRLSNVSAYGTDIALV